MIKKIRILGIAPYKGLATLMKQCALQYPEIAGDFPVIYGEGENIYMDLEKIAEVFAMTVRDWKPKRANLVPVFWAILIQRSTS